MITMKMRRKSQYECDGEDVVTTRRPIWWQLWGWKEDHKTKALVGTL
jgi:hypothetical protein